MTALLHHLPGLPLFGFLVVVAFAALRIFQARAWLFDAPPVVRRTAWEWVAYVALGLWLVLWAFLDLWPRKRAAKLNSACMTCDLGAGQVCSRCAP